MGRFKWVSFLLLPAGLGPIQAANPVQVVNAARTPWRLVSAGAHTCPLRVTVTDAKGKLSVTHYPAPQARIAQALWVQDPSLDSRIRRFVDYINSFRFMVDIPPGGSATLETVDPVEEAQAAFIPVDCANNRQSVSANWRQDQPSLLYYRVKYLTMTEPFAPVEFHWSGGAMANIFTQDPQQPTVVTLVADTWGIIDHRPFEGIGGGPGAQLLAAGADQGEEDDPASR